MKKLILLLITILSISCTENPNIVGLWEVTSVTVDGNEITPNGRWMRFHENGSQESGNGWLQHSVGTWKLNADNNALEVIDTNGTIDPSDPFIVTLTPNEMTWNRTEMGQAVEVKLVRADKLPKINADALFGLWMLENAEGTYDYYGSETFGGLFLRWDKRVEMYTPNGTIHGVYNVHGHKDEVEFIPYGDKPRSWWALEVDDSSLKLTLLNSDVPVTRTFNRIYEMPE